MQLPRILDRLESFYGPQEPAWPMDPYLFLVWWHCGYPASDAACAKGWDSLNRTIGVEPQDLLAAPPKKLAAALKPGGMVPELRALRLKEVAARVNDEFGGDLRAALAGPVAQARKILKKFPGIADPGADRVLLFGRIAPIPAVPSNATQVLARIARGRDAGSYSADYAEGQHILATEIPQKFDTLARAYLLIKRHGQELCKRGKPKCDQCPASASCAYFR